MFIVSRLDIRFGEDYPKLADSQNVDQFYSQYLPNPFPDKADVALALKQIVAVMDAGSKGVTYDQVDKMKKDEAKKLQNITLLVSESDIDPNDDREKFTKAYGLPVEIVNDEKIDEAILASNPQYAAIKTIPYLDPNTEKVKFQFKVYDCESGKTLATSDPQEKSGASVETGTISALKSLKKAATDDKIPPVRKENLSDFAMMAK